MTAPDPSLGSRLRRATHHAPDASTRDRHVMAIRAAAAGDVMATPSTARAYPPAMGPRWLTLRTRAVAATAVAAVAIPGVAVAAESAVPGALLWNVKRATEPVRSLIDADVVARHRVDELEALIAAGARPEALEAALRRAEFATAANPTPQLLARLAAARSRLAPSPTNLPPEVEDHDDPPPGDTRSLPGDPRPDAATDEPADPGDSGHTADPGPRTGPRQEGTDSHGDANDEGPTGRASEDQDGQPGSDEPDGANQDDSAGQTPDERDDDPGTETSDGPGGQGPAGPSPSGPDDDTAADDALPSSGEDPVGGESETDQGAQ